MSLATAWRRIRGRFYASRRFVIIRKRLTDSPAPDRLGEVVFRRATPTDLARLDSLDAYGRGRTQRTLVENRQDILFVACHGDRLVATRRCSREIRDAVVARAIQLGPRQVWIADIFCLPEYRSQAVSRHLILFADRELASEGYTDALAAVDADNAPSLRTSFRSGSEATRYVSYLRLFGYERLSIRTQLPSPLRARLEPRQ